MSIIRESDLLQSTSSLISKCQRQLRATSCKLYTAKRRRSSSPLWVTQLRMALPSPSKISVIANWHTVGRMSDTLICCSSAFVRCLSVTVITVLFIEHQPALSETKNNKWVIMPATAAVTINTATIMSSLTALINQMWTLCAERHATLKMTIYTSVNAQCAALHELIIESGETETRWVLPILLKWKKSGSDINNWRVLIDIIQ